MESPWTNFTYEELACKCGNCDSDGTEISTELMDYVQTLRTELGFSMAVTSAIRCANHPNEINKSAPGTHQQCIAIDFGISRAQAHELLSAAMVMGVFGGIGVNQKGNGRFVHLDIRPMSERTIWSY